MPDTDTSHPPGSHPPQPASGSLEEPEFLRLAIQTALAAVITMGEDGRISGWGARAEQTFGWQAAEVIGHNLAATIIPERYRAAHEEGLARFRATREGAVLGAVLEVSALRRDGTEFPVELRISPAAELSSGTTFIAFVLDISERASARDELESAYRRATESLSAIDGFIQTVVHDLRQPLTVARGYLDLVSEGVDAQTQRQYLQTAGQKLDDASHMIDEILLATRRAEETVLAAPADLDLGDLAREAVERAGADFDLAAGRIALTAPDGPVMVRADPPAVRRILDNLIGNALRYSPPPADVVVGVEADGTVAVADHGRGVPPGMHERIFERYVRVYDLASPPGTGLGLYVARKLAEEQGGSLVLEASEVGAGSTFRLRLPGAGAGA